MPANFSLYGGRVAGREVVELDRDSREGFARRGDEFVDQRAVLAVAKAGLLEPE